MKITSRERAFILRERAKKAQANSAAAPKRVAKAPVRRPVKRVQARNEVVIANIIPSQKVAGAKTRKIALSKDEVSFIARRRAALKSIKARKAAEARSKSRRPQFIVADVVSEESVVDEIETTDVESLPSEPSGDDLVAEQDITNPDEEQQDNGTIGFLPGDKASARKKALARAKARKASEAKAAFNRRKADLARLLEAAEGDPDEDDVTEDIEEVEVEDSADGDVTEEDVTEDIEEDDVDDDVDDVKESRYQTRSVKPGKKRQALSLGGRRSSTSIADASDSLLFL